MDPFSDDRPELSGTLISMEFGPGGRILQLWASDPALPDEGEDFQFVLPPLAFGEESADDLYPGTILLSARTNPDDPWMSSRNGTGTRLVVSNQDSDDNPAPDVIEFEYEFPFLPEIAAVGRFYELMGPVPQICWDLEIKNQGRKVLEIGELGFPLPLNTFYDGFGWTDDQLRRLWTNRLYVHKFIGGAASWLFAQRMTAEPPGLLVFPGDNTGWEFYVTVPASLNTPHQWEGIPVVYIHSRATLEREGWKGWWNQHTSLILEPGDSRTFQMRFVSAERDKQDGVSQTLAACGRPAIRLLPSAVVPADVGVGIEIQGATPTKFFVTKDAQIETDFDEEGGFCFVRPKEPGPVRVSFEDTEGRTSYLHLMFTDSIKTLINRRAKWICDNQFHKGPNELLKHGILLSNCETHDQVVDAAEYAGASGVECSLADALFLAEKNSIYPIRREIRILDQYIADFLQDDIQNPGDMAVGSVLEGINTVGSYAGRPLTYPPVYSLYHAMYRIASVYGETQHRNPKVYLRWAAETAIAMFKFGWRHYVRTVGLLGYARIYDILADLERENLTEEFATLTKFVVGKAEELMKQTYPYAGESVLDTSGFEEVFSAAMFLENDEHLERTMRCAFAARSMSPSWWWYGSDKRSWDGADSTPLQALIDRGEACLAHTTIPNSTIFFRQLDRDYLAIPDAYMRLAFGGMIGPWALVRNDGAVSMCYCPDMSSKHHGYNPFTGASGLGYFHYLRQAGAYVLPNRTFGLFAFGCRFSQEGNTYVVRPWDGIGQRIFLRQIDCDLSLSFGNIVQVTLDTRKRWAELVIENPSDKTIRTELQIKGLWGRQVSVQNRNYSNVGGAVSASFELPANKRSTVMVKVVK